MHKEKLLVVDDHKIIIQGIKSALLEYPEFEIVGAAFNGHDAIRQVVKLKPSIVIMDVSMPNLNGIDATLQIKKLAPEIRIVVFTIHGDREYIVDLFKAGISGYVMKEDPISDLIMALRSAQKGALYLSGSVPNVLPGYLAHLEEELGQKDRFDELTLREREVFQLLAEGKSIKDISAILNISSKTVETHKAKIMHKLEVTNPIDIIRTAIRKKIIRP